MVAGSRWLGHSNPEITCRVYSYLMPGDEHVGRAAMATTIAKVAQAEVYPLCTREATK